MKASGAKITWREINENKSEKITQQRRRKDTAEKKLTQQEPPRHTDWPDQSEGSLNVEKEKQVQDRGNKT